jgi:DNA-binding transcriptional LysR family regulator
MSLRFRQIEVFRSVMAAGTTTRAAADLSISQPAVSRHIADLEAHLGFKLFNRLKGRLEPTPSAVEFALIVEQNFLGLERIEHAAESIRGGLPQPVAVACLPALSTSLLPRVARRIMESNRNLGLFIDTGTVAEIIVKLQNLSADLALTLTFPPILGIEIEPLFTVEHVCAVPADHRLARKERITPADFHEERIIGWSTAGPLTFEKESALFADYVSGKDVAVTTHTSHTRYAMVAAGLGITIAEPFAAEPWINKGVVLRPFEPRMDLSYSLCYPTGRIRSENVIAVRRAVLATVQAWQSDETSFVRLRLTDGAS